ALIQRSSKDAKVRILFSKNLNRRRKRRLGRSKKIPDISARLSRVRPRLQVERMASSRRLCATDSSAGSNHRGRNRGETLNTHACARLELAGQNNATRAGSVSAHTQMPASDRCRATPPNRILRTNLRHPIL